MSLRCWPSCLLVACAVAWTSAQEPPKASYEALLEKVKKSDPKVDFTALRLAFTDTPAYNPYDIADRAGRDAMFVAFTKKEYGKALEQAEKCLQKNYLDIEAHRIAGQAHTELKNPEKAKFHHDVRDGLLQSILKSGDGKSPKTAYVVICTDEEYAVLADQRIKFTQQGLIRQEGHRYDRLDGVSDATGKAVTRFFNIDCQFKWLEESLKKKK